MSELISVILPTYNRAHTLDRAISSVVGQSYLDWQLYIVDDASTDETASVLRSWQEKCEKITFIKRGENLGVSAARNLGIQKSKGSQLSFIDSDDEWLPDKLQKQTQFFKNHPEINIVHSNELWIRNGVRVNPMTKHKKTGGWIFEECLKICCIGPSTVMLRRELMDKVGPFREDFPVCEDYDLWLKICSQEPVGFIEEALIKKYGGHEDQLSRKFTAMDYWRILSIESLLEMSSLKEGWRQLAMEQLQKKKQILLKGYRKHENLSLYDEVFRKYAVPFPEATRP